MAPYNLSDLAVKEIKIQRKDLSPVEEKSYAGNFLLAHLLDFWALFWMTSLSVRMFKGSLKEFLNTEGLRNAWSLVDFSFPTMVVWTGFALCYFFFSYSFNHGQTWGMKVTKCRVNLNHQHARGALEWALFSLTLILTLGLNYKAGTGLLSRSGKITAHDHLWRELMAQKQVIAPQLQTLLAEEKERDLPQAA